MLGKKRKEKKEKAIEIGQAPTQQLRTCSVSEHFSKTPAPTEEEINIYFIFIIIISLFPHLHTAPPPPFSLSLVSLMVSVDVKHHVYLLRVRS